jgi:hypothetical protein
MVYDGLCELHQVLAKKGQQTWVSHTGCFAVAVLDRSRAPVVQGILAVKLEELALTLDDNMALLVDRQVSFFAYDRGAILMLLTTIAY